MSIFEDLKQASTGKLPSRRKLPFTIHGSDSRGIEEIIPELGVPLAKFTVPSWAVASVQDILENCAQD